MSYDKDDSQLDIFQGLRLVKAPTVATPDIMTHRFGSMELRCVVRDGEPWFFAVDVCNALNYVDAGVALRKLEDDEKSKLSNPVSDTGWNIVNESGLYTLVLRSDKPEAKAYRKWVTSEVLPAIRKTGGYNHAPRIPTHLETAKALVTSLEEIEALKAEKAVLVPKAEIYDKHFDSSGNRTLTVVAKELGYKRNVLIANLRSMKLVYRQGRYLVPYENHITAGRFTVKMDSNEHGASWAQMYVTPKGELYIAELLQKELKKLPPSDVEA